MGYTDEDFSADPVLASALDPGTLRPRDLTPAISSAGG
jgi:hypothetical protein